MQPINDRIDKLDWKSIRAELHDKGFAAVANQWMEELDLPARFPESHPEMVRLCREKGQTKPTALILKYGQGGFNTLHQDLYGEVFFPMQMVFVLNQTGEDFTGGEFVITEQIPRASRFSLGIIFHEGLS